jgi:sarcosine oxidase subunit gamma
MAEEVLRTPLDQLSTAMAEVSGRGARLSALPPTTEVGLRASEPATVARLSGLLRLVLPREPNSVALGDGGRALWLGPDEWLVAAPDRDASELVAALEAAGSADGGLVTAVDLSASRVAIELSGPRSVNVLGHGCSLDLRDRTFPIGACAQTLLARLQVVLERTAPTVYVIRVRRSFSPYLVAWLLDVMPEYGRLE